MSLNDPIPGQTSGQQPPEWGASDYAAWGLNTAIWGTGKVVQYGILKPMEILGSGAQLLENYLFDLKAASESTASLEDRDVIHTSENTKIPPDQALKTMQGGKFDRDAKVADLENQVIELKRQLKELQDANQQSETDETISNEKQVVSPELRAREAMEKPARGDGSPRKTGQGIQFNKAEGADDAEDIANPVADTKLAEVSNDSVIQEYTSPLYDEEDKAEILQQLEKTLEEKSPNVQLNVLLEPPPPVPRATAGATRGRGGPAKKGGEGRSNDEALLTRLGVTAATLQQRRDAFLVVHKELADYIKTTGSEIRDIKAKNGEIINSACNFEKTRPENLTKLSKMQGDLETAKSKLDSFSEVIEKYQNLKETDPVAASRMQIQFYAEVGEGEKKQLKIVYETLEQVVAKGLIKGYEEDVRNIEASIKNQIRSINSATQSYSGKIYPQELKYVSKSKTSDGEESVENKKITVVEVLNLEKNIRVARDKLEVLRDNMKVYKVELPKEKVEVVVEELTPEQKELAKQMEEERKKKREKELQDKVGALKPGNVSAYSFKLVDDDDT